MQDRLQTMIPETAVLKYVGREEAASPATGSYKLHEIEDQIRECKVYAPQDGMVVYYKADPSALADFALQADRVPAVLGRLVSEFQINTIFHLASLLSTRAEFTPVFISSVLTAMARCEERYQLSKWPALMVAGLWTGVLSV